MRAARDTTLTDVPDQWINRHFAWLALAYPEGANRHLFDTPAGTYPIRVRRLRQRSSIPEGILELLEARDSLPSALLDNMADADEAAPFIRKEPTRISRLVKSSIISAAANEKAGPDQENDDEEVDGSADGTPQAITIGSPLSVVLQYLTVPTMPGSEAYALLALRNLLFETFDVFPADVGMPRPNSFKVADIETSLSHIWTSFRARHHSRGRDPLPAEGRMDVSGMLRHFLAATQILCLQFESGDAAIEYLSAGLLRPDGPVFEFVRSDHLDRLPELGEVVNQLWGLPIPIRGAETIFRGGLKFSSRQGLVVGVHGGPGTGKTSLALAIGATLAPFGIDTLFITAEETRDDLLAKAQGLLPDELRRLSFFPSEPDWIEFEHLPMGRSERGQTDPLETLGHALSQLSAALSARPEESDPHRAAKPCRAVVVLDGIHDLVMGSSWNAGENDLGSLRQRLRDFIHECRELRALVIMTAGEDWAGDRAFDYLVDVVLRLSHEAVGETGRKPDRRITVSKSRHQLCAIGTHGLQITGTKGVRFSPQINYQLDRKALWRTRLPDMSVDKKVLQLALRQEDFEAFARLPSRRLRPEKFHESEAGVRLFRGSNIFLNGEGSGGKAALALKLAISPFFREDGTIIEQRERVLVVSFLYPEQYYLNIRSTLLNLRHGEYGLSRRYLAPTLSVIHLYPGNYRADQLFNRVEWELSSADLNGDPYTAVVIDGLHNVTLQFPEIENYPLFWPQLYASLRSRPITIVSTHTTFGHQGAHNSDQRPVEDRRSEPMRHFLVQNTDFRFEIDPVVADKSGMYYRPLGWAASNVFSIRTVAAINQPIPRRDLLWSRDKLVIFDSDQGELPLRPSGRLRLQG